MKKSFLLLAFIAGGFAVHAQAYTLKEAGTFLKTFCSYSYRLIGDIVINGACKDVTIENRFIAIRTDIVKTTANVITGDKTENIIFDSRDIEPASTLIPLIDNGQEVSWAVNIKTKAGAKLILYESTERLPVTTGGLEHLYMDNINIIFGSRDAALRFQKIAKQIFK